MALVMVVDDDQRIRTLLCRILEEEGHDVVEASDGEAAISLFRQEPADLVITDIIMDGMDGYKTISQLTREFPGLKCIAISGGAKMGPFTYLMMARNCGAMRVLSKPFEPSEMIASVREVLRGDSIASDEPQGTSGLRKAKKTVLVIDPEPRHCWTLCEGLARAGHKVIDTRSGGYALDILTENDFDAVMVDVLASRFEGIDLIRCLNDLEKRPLIVAMADFESVCVRNAVMKRGADHFVGKPVDIGYVLKIMSPPPEFSGSVQGVDILEYLQFLLLTGRKILLEVRPSVGAPCQIYLEEGKVLHATCGESQGDEAFYRGVCFQGGEFANLPWKIPSRLSINLPGDLMLLEAARRRDEKMARS